MRDAKNTKLISISGKMGSGKDTAGGIIKDLLEENVGPNWEIAKFASGVKEVASIILGISIHQFENQEFKNSYLPECWNTHKAVFTDRSDFHGWEVESNRMTVREFLQKLGTEAMRDGLHENVWVNKLMRKYEHFNKMIPHVDDKSFPRWIITDTRFPNEYAALKEKEALFIKIVRPGLELNNHPSETSLDNHEFDYVINNDSDLYHLKEELKRVLVFEDYM
jgi:hypothetical protein